MGTYENNSQQSKDCRPEPCAQRDSYQTSENVVRAEGDVIRVSITSGLADRCRQYNLLLNPLRPNSNKITRLMQRVMSTAACIPFSRSIMRYDVLARGKIMGNDHFTLSVGSNNMFGFSLVMKSAQETRAAMIRVNVVALSIVIDCSPIAITVS